MKRSKIVGLVSVTGAALLWGVVQSHAQYVAPPQLVAGVDYSKPNYANSPILQKFVDPLPGLGAGGIPVGVPDTTTYSGSDYYEIALVDYMQQMHSALPPTKLRGYVQIYPPGTTGAGAVPLNDLNGTQMTYSNLPIYAYSQPSYLGPVIVATRGTPTRIKFYNLLPTGTTGDLFIPTDLTIMGTGLGPDGTTLYSQNRATLHLHGGDNPWISDGTAHQWITPVGEANIYKKGASQQNVPDMLPLPSEGDGTATFYWPNGLSGRLMFYHDHAFGMTRLNVYAGEAAGYLLVDPSERLINNLAPGGELPLVIQDKTFVNDGTLPLPAGYTGIAPLTTAAADPLWASNPAWGQTLGSLWFPHVYVPNQNPNDLSGANPVGRWDYGGWFWPVFPSFAPPEVSHVPESFMDTPLVNGKAYPYLNVQPTVYRFRILNACNDRFVNLQLYVADDTITTGPGVGTEVRMIPAVKGNGTAVGAKDAGTLWPAAWTAFDTPGMIPDVLDGRVGGVPDPSPSLQGPKMIQIGTEGGILPAPVVLENVPVGYVQNKRDIVVGNISAKTLLLGPAERADVIVDFSQHAGKTLILYSDSPAPVPAGDPRLDYFTGNLDYTLNGGAPTTQAGFGPNTRTIMQIRVAAPPGGQSIGSISLTAPGAGYSAPVVTITDTAPGTGSGATASATVSAGSIATISLVAPHWSGANYVAPIVNIGAPNLVDGIQATATAAINAFGDITAVTIVNPGSGYTAAPAVDITDAIGVPFVDYWPATAAATIVPAGTITGLTLLTPGAGYSAPVVTITDATGAGATATAALAPSALPALDTAGLNAAVVAAFSLTQPTPIVPLGSVPGQNVARISDTSMTFNGTTIPLQPKAIQELFDYYGRMNSTLGVEVPFTTALVQTTIPLGMADPATEVFADNAVQLWKITHNGVDTHAIHFHLFDVQIVNRVGWDGAIRVPDANEMGWKDTVRMNPLEDCIVALHAKVPTVPFEQPNSIRPLAPEAALGATLNEYPTPPLSGGGTPPVPNIFFGVDPANNPVIISNVMANFGHEYTWHCHLLGHEENDMMRPTCVAVPPKPPTGLAFVVSRGNAVLTWSDTSSDETGFRVQRRIGTGPWTTIGTTTNTTFTDTNFRPSQLPQYQVIALNTVGSGVAGYPSVTASSLPSNVAAAPLGRTTLTGTQALPVASPVVLRWTYSATDALWFTLQRSTRDTFPANQTTTVNVTNALTYADTTVVAGLARNTTFYYRVTPNNNNGTGAPSNLVTLLVHP